MELSDGLAQLWENLQTLVVVLGNLVLLLLEFALHYALLIAWVAWWLWGVNWKKAWPILAGGGWVPLVLLMTVAALVWSRIAPASYNFLGLVTLPNMLWQFGAVCGLVALTLFCGWLQGYFGWGPPDLDPNPPEASHAAHAEAHAEHAH
jgi:hypothetical protein